MARAAAGSLPGLSGFRPETLRSRLPMRRVRRSASRRLECAVDSGPKHKKTALPERMRRSVNLVAGARNHREIGIQLTPLTLILTRRLSRKSSGA